MVPKLLFKYKSLHKSNSMYAFDIIKNNRLYLSNRKQLNDPMEGIYTPIQLSTCGSSIVYVSELEQGPITEERDKYRILSLSATAFSPQMWAYYADSYRGICFAFYNRNQFLSVEQVIYAEPNVNIVINPQNIQDLICNDYKHKQISWRHEKEWRIIRRSTDIYFPYKPDDLACVIVHKDRTDSELFQTLKRLLSENIPIMKVIVGTYSVRLRLLDENYKMKYDGSEPPFIDTDEELYEYLTKTNNK